MIGTNFQRMMTGQGMVVSFTAKDPKAVEDLFQNGILEEMEVEIRKPKKKRSLDANAYMWVLLDKLAAALRTTAIEIYREMIQRVGVFDYVMVTDDKADDFIITWAMKGEGWMAQKVAHREKGTVLKVFKGSSAYTVEEMSRLIDEVQEECRSQGIETMTPDELKELLERWNQ